MGGHIQIIECLTLEAAFRKIKATIEEYEEKYYLHFSSAFIEYSSSRGLYICSVRLTK